MEGNVKFFLDFGITEIKISCYARTKELEKLIYPYSLSNSLADAIGLVGLVLERSGVNVLSDRFYFCFAIRFQRRSPLSNYSSPDVSTYSNLNDFIDRNWLLTDHLSVTDFDLPDWPTAPLIEFSELLGDRRRPIHRREWLKVTHSSI